MNERWLSDHQTPPGALNESSGEISELPEARSGEDTAEKFTPEYPPPPQPSQKIHSPNWVTDAQITERLP